MRRLFFNPIGAGGLLALSAAIPVSAQMETTKVVIERAQRMEAPGTITVVGTIEAYRTSRVGAEIAGRVVEMPFREGDFVEADDVVVRLDDETLQLRLTQERARLDRFRSAHEELLAGTRLAELDRLKALVEEASADYERWQLEMKRVERLYETQESNPKEYYDTRAELLRAKQRLAAAEAAHRLGVEGPRQEVIAQAAHEVAEQQAIVDRVLSDIEKTRIRAPFAGYITERLTELGEWISEADAVVTMVDLQPVLVRIDVPEFALPYLHAGEIALVKIDALGRSFEGAVRHIIRQANPNARTFPVKIELDNESRTLAAGMFARATVPGGPTEEAVAVPKDAIVEREGVVYVALLSRDGPNGPSGMLVPVTRGADIGNWIAITSGNLEAGDEVIIRGTERIMPFPTPVEIVDEHGTPVATPQGAGKRPPDQDSEGSRG